jgi:hypothetical protein
MLSLLPKTTKSVSVSAWRYGLEEELRTIKRYKKNIFGSFPLMYIIIRQKNKQ